MSIHHIQLWVPDLHRTERSWGWLLGELGYAIVREFDQGRVWRDGDGRHGAGIVIEQSSDMVPGMLHSRLRPGMNHVAFRVANTDLMDAIVTSAPEHGWRILETGAHQEIRGRPAIAYLEDHDGFEVELIGPNQADNAADDRIGRGTIDRTGAATSTAGGNQ